MTFSQTLADYAARLTYEDLPPEVVASTRLRLLDTVGVCLASLGFAPVGGTREQFGAVIRAEIAKWGKAITASGAKVN